MFNRNKIRARVLAHVEARIRDGQEEYEEGAEKEDAALADGITALTDACKRNKSVLEEGIVSKIIG